MIQREPDSSAAPHFSIVIPTYEDWTPLAGCLESLQKQQKAPSFEVIVVDDGSTQPAPEPDFSSRYEFPFTMIRQVHQGIPSARNHGIKVSKGTLLLFVDADCKLQPNCLAELALATAAARHQDYFQLHLVGNSGSLVGRAEDLRLSTFQNLMLQPDGRIRYLNTAGFAIRRARLDAKNELFDPEALRAEDTLLLANLMQRGELPLFVPNAVVEHDIPLSLAECLKKDIRSVYLERRAYQMIATMGLRIRVTHGERLRLLGSMWELAGQKSMGRSAWFVAVLRQAFQRVISLGYNYVPFGFAKAV